MPAWKRGSMTRRKGLTEYNWRILSRLLERHYSVRTAFEFLRKSEPDNRPLNLICDGLENGLPLEQLLGDSAFEKRLRFYIGYLPLSQSIGILQREIKEERETMKRFSSSVSYQIILVISSMAVLFLFTDVVLPSMLKSLDINGSQISGIVLGFRIINGIKNVFLIMAMLLVLFAGYIVIRRRQEYLWVFLHRHKLDGWLKTFVTCRLARKLSILLKQGVSIIDSLKILRYQNDDVLVRLLAHHFDETLLAGEDFEKSLDMEYFDDRFHSLCLLGLKSDDFPGALEDYIAIVETGVNLQIRKISVIFQVICYAFVAVTVIMAYQVLLLPLEMLQQF